MLAGLVARPRGRTIREVGSRAEGLALGAEDHGAAARVTVELLEGVRDLIDQRIVEVVVRRALHLDLPHVIGRHGDADVLVGAHGLLLHGRLVPRAESSASCAASIGFPARSEERRVGKECASRSGTRYWE